MISVISKTVSETEIVLTVEGLDESDALSVYNCVEVGLRLDNGPGLHPMIEPGFKVLFDSVRRVYEVHCRPFNSDVNDICCELRRQLLWKVYDFSYNQNKDLFSSC